MKITNPEYRMTLHPIEHEDDECIVGFFVGERGIQCKNCGLTSFNPDDVRFRYCGMCHSTATDRKCSKLEKQDSFELLSLAVRGFLQVLLACLIATWCLLWITGRLPR